MPKNPNVKRVMVIGSGPIVIGQAAEFDYAGTQACRSLKEEGVEVILVNSNPATIMTDKNIADKVYIEPLTVKVLEQIIEKEKPDYIVPEVEAIATTTLLELEQEGYHVIPTARATWLTMNREGIRRLAAEELGLPTSPYRFAATEEEFKEAVKVIGMPCVVKPIMSSSGHGQSVIRKEEDMDPAWHYAQEGGRAGAGKVIVEGFVNFDYEITQLTVRHIGGTSFLEPVGHVQVDGDYRESWQPQAMSPEAKAKAREIAGKITEALGGRGIFGVELFVKGDEVIFSEVSPRPHDTGMVTMITQDLSQFALHARAVLGLPIPNIAFHGPGASRAVVVEGDSTQLALGNLDKVLAQPDTQMRFFGKPEVHGHRRMAVLLARGLDVADARRKTGEMMKELMIQF